MDIVRSEIKKEVISDDRYCTAVLKKRYLFGLFILSLSLIIRRKSYRGAAKTNSATCKKDDSV